MAKLIAMDNFLALGLVFGVGLVTACVAAIWSSQRVRDFLDD
jgi:hypothetical protein